jgi:hypothetical protein
MPTYMLDLWDSEDKIKQELEKRLSFARQARKVQEKQWEENERAAFATRFEEFFSGGDVNLSFDSVSELGLAPVDGSANNIATNYIMKNLRFFHAQMSSNPPTVSPKPLTSDREDRRRADAADRCVRYGLRQYKMQERQDQVNLNTLLYGNGFAKTIFDPELGEIVSYREETNEVTTEGDFSYTVPSPWMVYPDADAVVWEDVRFVFEEIPLRYETACRLFPKKKDELQRYRLKSQDESANTAQSKSVISQRSYYDVVRVYQYWETGTPENGMQGRYCWCLEDGTQLTELSVSPHRFHTVNKDGSKGAPFAKLPYHLLTDIDVPGTYWGRSVVAYAAALQDVLNRLDNVMLDILAAHGVARLLMPESAEVAKGSITNSPWDIVKYTGAIPPNFMEPLPMPAALPNIRDRMKQNLDDIMGITEALMGQQSRETSGFSMQYAVEQSNMIRRRLFNKYVAFVENVYKTYLGVIKENWTTPRTIKVLGKERAFETVDLQGADIQGGFDLVVEYGTSFSLDPMARRQEILQLMPVLKEAGMTSRAILGMLRLNELDSLIDRTQLAASRQREVFDRMLANKIYIAPRELQEHRAMLEEAYNYVMSAEFDGLPEEDKALIERHIKEREAMAAQSGAEAAAAGGAEAANPLAALMGGGAPQ